LSLETLSRVEVNGPTLTLSEISLQIVRFQTFRKQSSITLFLSETNGETLLVTRTKLGREREAKRMLLLSERKCERVKEESERETRECECVRLRERERVKEREK
jgi:hypothetical protein